jgi:hypothetical protein
VIEEEELYFKIKKDMEGSESVFGTILLLMCKGDPKKRPSMNELLLVIENFEKYQKGEEKPKRKTFGKGGSNEIEIKKDALKKLQEENIKRKKELEKRIKLKENELLITPKKSFRSKR